MCDAIKHHKLHLCRMYIVTTITCTSALTVVKVGSDIAVTKEVLDQI